MSITRADTLTGSTKKQEYFSDFLDSFAKTPIGNQLGRVTNEQSVNQSLRNLVKTNLGERLFNPNLGGNVYGSLFELNDFELSIRLKSYIELTIKNNEPRVNLIDVQVATTLNRNISNIPGTSNDENTIQINIVYNLINNPETINLTIILKKVR